MEVSDNTILITGGGSGIGRGLAEAFHASGNKVIIAGRGKEVLEEAASANPGMETVTFDISDRAGIDKFAFEITSQYPDLNVLINNAGIMRREKLIEQQPDLADAEAIVSTNLLGPIHLTAALLPHLLGKSKSVVMNVSSGLAFVPLAITPTYSATKAAIHSYTQSLRYQLQGTGVQVIELPPPYVATDLMDGRTDPRAMPLDAFIAEVMEILTMNPNATEICVERVRGLRSAEATGKYDAIFKVLNDSMSV